MGGTKKLRVLSLAVLTTLSGLVLLCWPNKEDRNSVLQETSNAKSQHLENLYKSDEMMQVSRKNKLVYVHVPKTGGSSIEKSMIFDDAPTKKAGHYAINRMMKDADEREISNFVRTAHIRHPCSRFVSAFKYYTSGLKNYLGKKQMTERFIGNKTIDELAMHMDLHPEGERISKVQHFRPMHFWLFYPNGTFGLDTVLCQETWNDSLDRLGNLLEKPIPKEVYSRHDLSNPHEACEELSPETQAAIRHMYRLDYCIFAYSDQPTQACPQGEVTPMQYTRRYKECHRKLS